MKQFKNGYFKNDFPYIGDKINHKEMVGMDLYGEYKGVEFSGVHICEYIDKYKSNKFSSQFKVRYNEIEKVMSSSDVIRGRLGSILDIFVDINNKTFDEYGSLIINIENKKGQKFVAYYSGDNIDKVANTNWGITLNKHGYVHCVKTTNYNKTAKPIMLHQVDLGSWVDHINNNPLDNRIENLRKSNHQHNAMNKKSSNDTKITGIRKRGEAWNGCYRDITSKLSILTGTKHDFEEAKIDCLIAQRYMGYRHNEDLFYLLDSLPIERIKEVEDLLEKKIQKARNKVHEVGEYEHDIIDCGDYYKLIKGKKEMLFDCDLDFIKNKMICCGDKGYWMCQFVESGNKIKNQFYKELLELRPNEYKEYRIHIDHLNGNPNDNRFENLTITSVYSNQCNKKSEGYRKVESGSYISDYMCNYRFWNLIGGTKRPTFKTEQEAINEVNRRRQIIDNARVKLKSKQELDELITYCLDNKHILENGLADLDLGYLYWKEMCRM